MPFVLPSLTKGPIVIIPPAQLKQILSKPPSEIDALGPQTEEMQAPYTVRDKEIWINKLHLGVVRKQLTKDLPLLTENIAEELAIGFERHWGSPSKWKAVPAWDSVSKIVSQAANRVFVGIPLCAQPLPPS